MSLFKSITDTIGNTPLISMQRLGKDLPGNLYLKLEFFNPLSSVKDRIGLAMVETAEAAGALKPGMTIVEPTSGNTGIALSFVAAAKGYPIILTMPETMSLERRTLMLLLGAQVILTPGPLGMKGAIAKAKEILASTPNSWMPAQFDNPANPEIHRNTTAQEILKDMHGKSIDYFVSGVGTSGTITGVGEVLKKHNPNVKIVAVEPQESPVLSGGQPGPHKIQGIGAGFKPSVLNESIIDEVIQITSEESLATARETIKKEGIPVGISSGAAIAAGLKIAERTENKDRNVVVIVPSHTDRYLSTLLAQEEREQALNLKVCEIDEKYL